MDEDSLQRTKSFCFPPNHPCLRAADTDCGLTVPSLQNKEPEPQHGGTTPRSQGQEQSQGSADPAAGGCWHPAAGLPHAALLQVTFHELSPLRCQHSRDQIPEWQPKRRWEQLVSATHQHLQVLLLHHVPVCQAKTHGKHTEPAHQEQLGRGFPSSVSSRTVFCRKFLVFVQAPEANRSQSCPKACWQLALCCCIPCPPFVTTGRVRKGLLECSVTAAHEESCSLLRSITPFLGGSSPGGAGVQAARGLANGGARGGRRFVLRQNRLRTKL